MAAGSLDRKIDIERKTVSRSDYGAEVETWTKIATRRSAKVKPVSGDERFGSDQYIAKQQTEFTFRWSRSLADVNPLYRIVYPSQPDPPEHHIYDIASVSEEGRRQYLKVIAVRRAEVPGA